MRSGNPVAVDLRLKPPPRTQLAGHRAIRAALAERDDVRLLLVRRDDQRPDTLELIAQAEARGVRVWCGGPGDLRRLSREQLAAEERRAVALLGPPPTAAIDELLARGGLCWLLHQIAYPSNVGFAVRTAEVSGADGVIVDAPFNHEQRARIDHVSMGASLMLPIVYHDTLDALARAQAAGVQTVALEDVGACAPWQIDLRVPTLCVLGGERSGLPPAVLERCSHSVRIPMAGFVPSYNVQAVLAMIACERLRQLGD